MFSFSGPHQTRKTRQTLWYPTPSTGMRVFRGQAPLGPGTMAHYFEPYRATHERPP